MPIAIFKTKSDRVIGYSQIYFLESYRTVTKDINNMLMVDPISTYRFDEVFVDPDKFKVKSLSDLTHFQLIYPKSELISLQTIKKAKLYPGTHIETYSNCKVSSFEKVDNGILYGLQIQSADS